MNFARQRTTRLGWEGERVETRWRRTFQKGETETASSGRIKESSVEEAEHKIEAEADSGIRLGIN